MYRRFKHSFELEPYLTIVKSPPLRTALCRFCISCHLLEIERGRYQRSNPQPAEQRFCPSCLQLCKKLVEDEFHFLMSCDTYEEERSQLYNMATTSGVAKPETSQDTTTAHVPLIIIYPYIFQSKTIQYL